MNFYKNYIKEHAFVFWLCFALWLISFFGGVKTVFNYGDSSYMETANYLQNLACSEHPAGEIIKNGFLLNLKLMLVSSVCMYCVFFIPLSVALVCFKGFSAGFTVSYLIWSYGYGAYTLIALTVAVPMFFSLPVGFMIFTMQITQPIKYRQIKEKRLKAYLADVGALGLLYLMLDIITLIEALISPYAYRGM